MSQHVRAPICRFCSIRSYSASPVLHIPRNEAIWDPQRLIATRRNYPKPRREGPRPFLERYAGRSMTFAEKNEQQRARMQVQAEAISQSWPAGTRLVELPVIEEQDASDSAISITNMTTNFMIYLPYRIQQYRYASSRAPPDRQQILRNLRLLLLKRSPTANPLPSAWTAISGRLERRDNINPASSDVWETPLEGALREIKEETNHDPALFTLEAALPPSLVSTPGGRQWRVWPMLWQKQFRRRVHDFRLDENGDLTGEWERQSLQRLLGHLIRLDMENVEFRWETLEGARALPGVVPGLLDTFERVVEHWIEVEMLRFSGVRRVQLDSDAATTSDADAASGTSN